jgi:hypothetical protein
MPEIIQMIMAFKTKKNSLLIAKTKYQTGKPTGVLKRIAREYNKL